MIDLGLFRRPAFAAATLAALATGAGIIALLSYVSGLRRARPGPAADDDRVADAGVVRPERGHGGRRTPPPAPLDRPGPDGHRPRRDRRRPADALGRRHRQRRVAVRARAARGRRRHRRAERLPGSRERRQRACRTRQDWARERTTPLATSAPPLGVTVVSVVAVPSGPLTTAALVHGWNHAALVTAAVSLVGALLVLLVGERSTTATVEVRAPHDDRSGPVDFGRIGPSGWSESGLTWGHDLHHRHPAPDPLPPRRRRRGVRRSARR